MTADEWAEDRRVIDAASEGPWEVEADGSVVRRDEPVDVYILTGYGDEQAVADGQMAARARTRWPAALDRIAELEARLAAVLALHREDSENGPTGTCRECFGEPYPCATVRAAGGGA